MTTAVHIFTSPTQPATRYLVRLDDGKPLVIRNKPRARVRCSACRQLRWAANVTVQVYYDMNVYRCADGRGCKRRGGR